MNIFETMDLWLKNLVSRWNREGANRSPQSMGGLARAKILTPERRREISQAAARTRWEKHRFETTQQSKFHD